MRRSSILFALVATLVIAVPAAAAPPNRLLTFGTGEAMVEGDTVTLTNDADEYSGVYLNSRSQSGKPLKAVSFSFSYTGAVAGGAPRFSIPIDTDGNGSVDGYAFLDALNCGNTGTVSTESTDSFSCLVYFGPDQYLDWDAFAAANPDYRIAPGSIPFIIADQPGIYVITDIDLR